MIAIRKIVSGVISVAPIDTASWRKRADRSANYGGPRSGCHGIARYLGLNRIWRSIVPAAGGRVVVGLAPPTRVGSAHGAGDLRPAPAYRARPLGRRVAHTSSQCRGHVQSLPAAD